MGLGAYFLFLFQNNYAGSVMSILFGNIFAVSHAIDSVNCVGGINFTNNADYQPSIDFASIDPVVASSKMYRLDSFP